MKGIILANQVTASLYPTAAAVSKHLLPIFNKPMIYYPLTTLMLSGCREILIFVGVDEIDRFRLLLGNGSQWGLNIHYAAQAENAGVVDALLSGRPFIGQSRVALLLGDNVTFGNNLRDALGRLAEGSYASIFAYWVAAPSTYDVVEFDRQHRPLRIHSDPTDERSNWAVPSLYFYDSGVLDVIDALSRAGCRKPSVADINNHYLKMQRLDVERLGRGYAWLDIRTPADLLHAAQFIEITETRQGLQIGSPEEVAWRMGYIDDEGLGRQIQQLGGSEYGRHLMRLLT